MQISLLSYLAVAILFSITPSDHQTIHHNDLTGTPTHAIKATTPTLQAVAGNNIALGKPATQKNMDYGGRASRAVDGNTNGVYNNNSVTHTIVNTQDPWWQVDLGSDHTIDQIKLYNRTDCCSDRLRSIFLVLSTRTNANRAFGSANTVNEARSQGFQVIEVNVDPTGQLTTVSLLPNSQARFVRVWMQGTGTLSLAEVEVFGGSPGGNTTPSHGDLTQISLMFIYPGSLMTHSEMTTKVDQIMEEANQAFVNSGVDQRFQLASVERTSFDEETADVLGGIIINARNFTDFENDFTFDFWWMGAQNTPEKRAIGERARPIIRGIMDRRRQLQADIVVFIDFRGGGVAGANQNRGPHSAGVRMPLGLINGHILAHEIGHLQGLTHEMGATVPYDRATAGAQTIMAVNCAYADPVLDRPKMSVSMFSGQSSTYEGTTMWASCVWDAVSVLNATVTEFSQYGEMIASGNEYTTPIFPDEQISISLGDDCDAWIVDKNNTLWSWSGYDWEKSDLDQAVRQVAHSAQGQVWVVTTDNRLFDATTASLI